MSGPTQKRIQFDVSGEPYHREDRFFTNVQRYGTFRLTIVLGDIEFKEEKYRCLGRKTVSLKSVSYMMCSNRLF